MHAMQNGVKLLNTNNSLNTVFSNETLHKVNNIFVLRSKFLKKIDQHHIIINIIIYYISGY